MSAAHAYQPAHSFDSDIPACRSRGWCREEPQCRKARRLDARLERRQLVGMRHKGLAKHRRGTCCSLGHQSVEFFLRRVLHVGRHGRNGSSRAGPCSSLCRTSAHRSSAYRIRRQTISWPHKLTACTPDSYQLKRHRSYKSSRLREREFSSQFQTERLRSGLRPTIALFSVLHVRPVAERVQLPEATQASEELKHREQLIYETAACCDWVLPRVIWASHGLRMTVGCPAQEVF